MKRTHRHLEVVVGTQVDYVLPEGKAAIPQASQVVVPGLRRLMDLHPGNCAGVMFVNNYWTTDEYKKSDYAAELPPHCLIPGLEDYEAPGVQNVFSSFLLSPRGIPVHRCYKKSRDLWGKDMWDNWARISSMRGSAAHAETLPQFIAHINQLGISNVTVWGMDTETDVACAVDGFLVKGFKVRVIWDLCRAHAANNLILLTSKFNSALVDGQLEIVRYGDDLQAAKRKPL